MISIILFLALICSPDGIKSDNKGKPKGAEKLSQPPKGNLIIIPGNAPANAPTVYEDQPIIQKQTTPYVTNIQLGLTSSTTAYLISSGDTVQKSVTQPIDNLKWEP